MHAVFVSGIFQIVVNLLLRAISAQHRAIYEQLQEYLSFWTLPKRFGKTTLPSLFKLKRDPKGNVKFKCTASEGLSLYKILAYFVTAVPLKARLCEKECQAYLALTGLIDLLTSIACGMVSPEQLRLQVRCFLERCLEACWQPYMVSRFHWLLHLPHHLQRFGTLPACWVNERKHRAVKRYAQDVRNTSVFERSVLSEICCHDLHALGSTDAFVFEVGLVSPSVPSTAAQAFLQRFFDVCVSNRVAVSSVARVLPAGVCSKEIGRAHV